MKSVYSFIALVSVLVQATSVGAEEQAEKPIYPAAILTFEERGTNVKDYGHQAADLLFAALASNPDLYLVDREDLNKTLGEQSLGASGIVKPAEAAKLGQLTGAKLLVCGSVMQVDKKLILVAKIIGTETTRVVGTSVKGAAADNLSDLTDALAEKIGTLINERSSELVAKPLDHKDVVAELKKQIGEGKLPTLHIAVAERHVGVSTIDPAVETELSLIANGLGFEIVDGQQASKNTADVLVSGEGFSETVGRVGGLVSVKARVELKAVDRKTGKVLFADRQTSVVVDGTEQIAGKTALQEAAMQLAERLMPALVIKQ